MYTCVYYSHFRKQEIEASKDQIISQSQTVDKVIELGYEFRSI